MTIQQIKSDLILFAYDLPEYQNMPEGRAISKLWYAYYNYDIEGIEYEDFRPEVAFINAMSRAIGNYWDARNN